MNSSRYYSIPGFLHSPPCKATLDAPCRCTMRLKGDDAKRDVTTVTSAMPLVACYRQLNGDSFKILLPKSYL